MQVEISPTAVEATAGLASAFTVTITNTSDRIDGYHLEVYGLDPGWVSTSHRRLSLFPGQTEVVTISFVLPDDFPSSQRSLGLHVRAENDPGSFSLGQVLLDVAPDPRPTVRVDPASVTGGREAVFGIVATNDGNTTLHLLPTAVDPENTAAFQFQPTHLTLLPGHTDTVQVRARGGRNWFGLPRARVFTFGVEAQGGVRAEAVGLFVQRPRIGRWLLSLLGLLTAAAVFAAVLSRTFDQVAQESAVDPRLVDAALATGASGGQTVSTNPASITGEVRSATTQSGVAGIQAELFDAGDPVVPLASAATDTDGRFTFARLGEGEYLVRFSGAGFDELWYPGVATAADAEPVAVEAGAPLQLDPVDLAARPGSVSGNVVAEDPVGITATLVASGSIDPDVPAEVQRVDVAADGTFLFESVPSPAVYQLVVEKVGFATDVRDVVLQPAQQLEGIEVVLREGDGVIAGTVSGVGGPLGGVTVEATDGTTTIATVSLTEGEVGAFSLRNLPTPGRYTLTFSRDGYRSESRSVALAAGQQVDGVGILLTSATGSISGTVRGPDGPLGGVTVTVTGGDVEVTTVTVSQVDPVGTYAVTRLAVPATYTITFSAPGFVDQVRIEDLDPLNGTSDLLAVDATMVRADATVRGVVRGPDGDPVPLATVRLSDGATTRTVTTAHDPLGEFELTGVAPGNYTLEASLPGATPAVQIVNVVASETATVELQLAQRAAFEGRVLREEQGGTRTPYANATVRLYLADQFPAGAVLATATTGADGSYSFEDLTAPADHVIAVFASPDAADSLASQSVRSQPSVRVPVPDLVVVPLG
jgi:hypothetical protein